MLESNHPRDNAREMRFYINILTTYFPDLDPPYDTYYQQILEQVELAEELGWECFMFNEHHFLGYGGLVANPAVLLAAAAARTSKIRLGPCIAILPLRHPLPWIPWAPLPQQQRVLSQAACPQLRELARLRSELARRAGWGAPEAPG